MIENATILRIDRKTGRDAGGRPIYGDGNGPDVAIRCFVSQIQNAMRYTLGASLKDATRLVMIPDLNLSQADEDLPDTGDRVILTTDRAGDEQETWEVVMTREQLLEEGSDLNHFEVFSKPI